MHSRRPRAQFLYEAHARQSAMAQNHDESPNQSLLGLAAFGTDQQADIFGTSLLKVGLFSLSASTSFSSS